jgi:hypothetical protein
MIAVSKNGRLSDCKTIAVSEYGFCTYAATL